MFILYLDPEQLYVIFERSKYSESNLEVFHRGGEGLDTSRSFIFERMVDDHESIYGENNRRQSDAEKTRALATSMRATILSLHRALIRKENDKISDRYKECSILFLMMFLSYFLIFAIPPSSLCFFSSSSSPFFILLFPFIFFD